MWYLCGLGSNIRPETNLPCAVAELATRYGTLWLSPVLRTRPPGMATPHAFLNALVVLRCELSQAALKLEFNALEEQMGRNRSDPQSRYSDRPIDVDILESSPRRHFTGSGIHESYYCALCHDTGSQPTVTLCLNGQSLGQAPATIYWNESTGHEVIVEQGKQLQYDTAKPTLPG